MGALAAPLIGGGLGLLGSILQGNANQWNQGLIVNILNQLAQGNSTGLNQALALLQPLMQTAGTSTAKGNMFTWGDDTGNVPGALTSTNDATHALYNSLLGNPLAYQSAGMTPQMAQALGGMQGLQGQLDPLTAQMLGLSANGGNTADAQWLNDRLHEFSTGQGAPLDSLQNVGGEILGNRGQTALSQQMQNTAGSVLANGGRTPQLDQASQIAMQLAQNGGMTPEIAAGMQQLMGVMGSGGQTPAGALGENNALQTLMSGGNTPYTDFLQQRGAQLASQDAVLPMSTAIGFARDEAGRAMQQQAEHARAQSVLRGAGPGAVYNNAGNDAMLSFADQGANAQAQAVQNAMMGQQQALLQQQASGANMMGTGGGLANQRYNTAGGILGNLEGTAANRFGTATAGYNNLAGLQANNLFNALGELPAINQAELNNVLGYGGLGAGAAGLDLSRMGLGGQLTQEYNQDRLAGMGALSGLLGQQQNYGLGAGALGSSLAGQQGNLLNSILGGNVAAGNMAQNYYNMLGNLLSQGGSLAGLGLQSTQTGINPITQAMNSFLGYGGNALGSLTGLAGYRQPSAMGNFLGNFGAGVATGGIQFPNFGGGNNGGGTYPDFGQFGGG